MTLSCSAAIILGSVLVLALGGCDLDGRQGVMLVDHYKVPCEGVGPQRCLPATGGLDGICGPRHGNVVMEPG